MLADIDLRGRILIKIDVEGFEHRVIDGLCKTLQRSNVMLSVEVTDAWLRETGSSARALLNSLARLGFEAWLMSARIRGLERSLVLSPLHDPPLWQHDVFFIRPDRGRARGAAWNNATDSSGRPR